MDWTPLAQERPSNKGKQKGREDREEDVYSYWIILGKREGTVN